MYDNGHGVTQDYILAYMWFNLGGALGDTNAIENRDLVAKKMSPQQISKAQKMTSDCQQKKFIGCD